MIFFDTHLGNTELYNLLVHKFVLELHAEFCPLSFRINCLWVWLTFIYQKSLLGKFEVGEEVCNVSVHEILCSFQGPVVQRLISPNSGLNCNPAFFISLFKVLLGKFSLFFLEHPMIKLQAKIFELNFLSKFSDLKSNFTLTLGYLNPPLNNQGQNWDIYWWRYICLYVVLKLSV